MEYALVMDDTVIEVKTLTDEQVQDHARIYPLVIDVTESNPKPIAGWKWNGQKLVPGAGMSSTASIKITKLALMNRFTIPELGAIYTAMATNVMVKILMDKLMAASHIDLSRIDTQQGIGYLAQLGLITPERMTAILTSTPTELEVFR